jgi:hypothetical protein
LVTNSGLIPFSHASQRLISHTHTLHHPFTACYARIGLPGLPAHSARATCFAWNGQVKSFFSSRHLHITRHNSLVLTAPDTQIGDANEAMGLRGVKFGSLKNWRLQRTTEYWCCSTSGRSALGCSSSVLDRELSEGKSPPAPPALPPPRARRAGWR